MQRPSRWDDIILLSGAVGPVTMVLFAVFMFTGSPLALTAAKVSCGAFVVWAGIAFAWSGWRQRGR